MDWGFLIKASGITAGICVTGAFIFGFFKIKMRKRLVVHKMFGIAALAAVLIHTGINYYVGNMM
ncbi:MAG TPA: hypothetical protein ENN55_04665 [Firmicutes bacterium]|nr:hypothetical protein [Bacillota bacterium]